MNNDTKHSGGRKRTGSLVWRKSGWYGRFWRTVNGIEKRVCEPLGTDDKIAARHRLAEKMAGGEAPTEQPGAPMTVDAYAIAWLDRRDRSKLAAAVYERNYYQRIWRPVIGHLALGAVTVGMVNNVLADLASGEIRQRGKKKKGEPYSLQTVAHIRSSALRLFGAAVKEELIPRNAVTNSEIPAMPEEEEKPRTVLTDAELAVFVAHPDVSLEIKVLVLLARTIGGLRAGDLNALKWQAFSPGFLTATFLRQKTKRARMTKGRAAKKKGPETHKVPPAVRSFIQAWFMAEGCPAGDRPVFQQRHGKDAGEHRKAANTSYAGLLRRSLKRAGITRHELHFETASTLPIDFHSTRRGYAQALAVAGVNEQEAMDLTGHSDSRVHKLYLANVRIKELPESAIPDIPSYVDPCQNAANSNGGRLLSAGQNTGINRAVASSES